MGQSQEFILRDVVATQGAYLVKAPRTPVFQKAYDEEFLKKLDRAFELIEFEQRIRRQMYHEAADEWPIGRTPPEVKERRRLELEASNASNSWPLPEHLMLWQRPLQTRTATATRPLMQLLNMAGPQPPGRNIQ